MYFAAPEPMSRTDFRKRIFYHIAFWLTYLLWGGYVLGSYDGNYNRSFLNDLVHLPLKISVTYFIMYFLLPRYMKEGSSPRLALLFALLVLVGGLIFRFTIYTVTQPYFYPESEIHFWNPPKFLWGVFEVFSISAIAVSIKLFISKYEGMRREQELEKEKLKTELSFLKAQINPHFLFNTLNNIYGLSLKNSPMTSESILKLSGLLHFMIHDGAADRIRISDEISTLRDYIELEKLRYGNRLTCTFETNVDNENEQIAPLILLSFVENSFKHGASESRNQSAIHISLTLQNGILRFQVSNTMEEIASPGEGIGLKNTSRQLELIYGRNHELAVEIKNSLFTVSLTINLKKHAETELPDH